MDKYVHVFEKIHHLTAVCCYNVKTSGQLTYNTIQYLGFQQACKDHMTLVHDVTDFQTSCRVDAGTQVEPRKRQGRKKKSEMVEQEKSEQEEIVLSDTDEDWAEQLLSYSTRSRRKRKPPQALRNDYYLGRTKKKEQKKRELRDLNVDCEVHGNFLFLNPFLCHLQVLFTGIKVSTWCW